MNHPPRNIAIDWLNTIWETDLPSNAKLIACNLRRYMTGKKEMAYPGVNTIAGECGLSDRCVQTHLKLLCQEGWLVNNGKSHLLTTIYAASIPPEIISPPKQTTKTPETISGKKVSKKVIGIKGWDEWDVYRREIKKKLTPSTINKQVKFLDNRSPEQQQAIIDQSITNGWTGLFEIKEQQNGHAKNGRGNSQGIETKRASDYL